MSRLTWSSKVLVFVEGGKVEKPGKTLTAEREREHLSTALTMLPIIIRISLASSKDINSDKSPHVSALSHKPQPFLTL